MPVPEDTQLETSEEFRVGAVQMQQPKQKRWSREHAVEDARTHIAVGLALLYALSIVIPLLAFLHDGNLWSHMKEFFSLVLASESALLGSVIGFYFGAQAKK